MNIMHMILIAIICLGGCGEAPNDCVPAFGSDMCYCTYLPRLYNGPWAVIKATGEKIESSMGNCSYDGSWAEVESEGIHHYHRAIVRIYIKEILLDPRGLVNNLTINTITYDNLMGGNNQWYWQGERIYVLMRGLSGLTCEKNQEEWYIAGIERNDGDIIGEYCDEYITATKDVIVGIMSNAQKYEANDQRAMSGCLEAARHAGAFEHTCVR